MQHDGQKKGVFSSVQPARTRAKCVAGCWMWTWLITRRSPSGFSEQMAMHRVGYSFQTVARAQLFVGMMKMIAKRLQGDL